MGVNRFTVEEETHPEILRVDPALQEQQVAQLHALRAERDAQATASALERLSNAASTNANLMPLIIDCVEQLCTLGEISDTLRQVFGTYDG